MTNTKMTQFKPTPFMNNCSRIFINYAIYIFLIYVISGVGKACNFPSHLKTQAIWTATHSDKRTVQGYFKGNLMQFSRCDMDGNCFQYTRRCLSRQSNNKYEVQHQSNKGSTPPIFLCIQILQRGTSIIQIKESQELYFRSANACDDNHLILDNWPMVTNDKFVDQKVPCPFSGGYNIRLHSSDKQPKCDREIIPARLESECEQGDGMTINFHSKECLEKDLEMNVEQSFYCAATWAHGNYTFVILRPQNDEFKAWCMRFTGTDFNKPIEHGHLFVDLVCDPGDGNGNIRETSRYLYLEFTQRIISSTCADSYARICDDDRLCKYNDETYSVNCRRFCNYCSAEQNQCTFPPYFQGGWVGNSHGEQKEVRMSYYDIDISGTGQFQCHEPDGHDFENRTMLLQTFSNGCYPRYACFEGKKVSSSILEYRLGNRISWPVKNWDLLKEDVCADQQFEPSARDKEKFGRRIDEKPTTILVDSKHHFSVSCNLKAWPGLTDNRLYMQESNVCEYCFLYNASTKRSQQKFIAQPFNCTSGNTLDHRVYHCLGVFPQGDNIHAVVTRTIHAHHEYLCWVFIHEEDNDDRVGIVYVLDATNCNKVAIKAVRDGTLVPKRTLVLPKNRQNCPYIEPILQQTTPFGHETTKKPHYMTPKYDKSGTTYYSALTSSHRANPQTYYTSPLYSNLESSSPCIKCLSKSTVLLLFTLLFINYLT